ncbi:MAG: hypothetical protein KGH72_02105 [Candidatus Micrarchaeota archaeon]|nr:hypothetical protein [Candidatus Micrarchaeota archaeon]
MLERITFSRLARDSNDRSRMIAEAETMLYGLPVLGVLFEGIGAWALSTATKPTDIAAGVVSIAIGTSGLGVAAYAKMRLKELRRQ